MPEERKFAFEVEVRLLRWGESSTQGRTVTFQLDDEAEFHPFRGIASGPTGGQRFRMRFEPVMDDETSVSETENEVRAKKAVTLAVLLAKDPKFLLFLRKYHRSTFSEALASAPEPGDENVAKQMLRLLCGVDSLSKLAGEESARGVLYDLDQQYRVVREAL